MTLTHPYGSVKLPPVEPVVTCRKKGLGGAREGRIAVGSRWRVLAVVPFRSGSDRLLWHDFRLESVKTGKRILVSRAVLLAFFSGACRLVQDRRFKQYFAEHPDQPKLRRVRDAVGCVACTADKPMRRAQA